MKKILCLCLSLIMVLSMVACGGSGDAGENGSTTAPKAEGLQIGYARESIMPEGQVNISGSGNQEHRVSTGYLDILYATCLAISENGNTILLYSTDTLTAKNSWTATARQLISTATGVPQNNIHIGATHTHSGPAVGGNEPLVQKWAEVYMNALIKSAEDAIADQAPATLYGKKVQTEQMNFVRHYKMDDGSYAGSNFGDFSKTIVGHATEGDEEMTLIKIDREGDKKDIMLMNFQGHPCFASGSNYNELSADYIGTTRDAFEKATGMQFIYFLGATGNQNTSSRVGSENGTHNNDRVEYGAKLAQYAIDALPTMTTPIEGSGVKTTQKKLTYKSNKYGQDRLADAQKVATLFSQTGDTSSANAMAKSMGFQSVYECRGIVGCASRPEISQMTIDACSFGGVGFVAASYEMFSNSGLYIKENSPYEFTVISTVTNGYNNYIPSLEAYMYGCYESYTAIYEAGTAEAAAEEFVNMLKSLQQ